ncbi:MULTISPECIES: hypothetical protein [Protofrankia]|uniref:Dihydrodipicolinate synthase/N-acetylneuraminate lyase n=1 Tax=Protofrankia coriariae TaxID=1562887 RepID=A0ABR5F624_9ACTN|nr:MULTISPECIES: hypothetical protein [Protofrankia]KLL12188.1 hypothetical protein FrCorBMG51_05450 [Protofrankia coriariae]ONH37478.1 hypothetical protein BL254_03320 [Protofrankia sp. BMG5.30]
MSLQLVIPALTFRTTDGAISTTDTERYARRAAATWADLFILSGTTTNGHTATTAERAATIDIWTAVISPDRITACCWSPADITEAERRGITPMVVLRDLHTIDQARGFLAALPNPSYVFSHPEFSGHTLTPDLAHSALAHGCLPRGAKVSKVGSEDLAALRGAAGPAFALWDGTARHIATSLAAGANGVVAAPLSHIPEPFPARDAPELQDAIDRTQTVLDQLPNRASRTDALINLARRGTTPRST